LSEASAPRQPAPDLAGKNIVVVGDLNPAILQPAWLAANELIREEEADKANVDIISRDLTSFSTDWLELLCTATRFQVGSSTAPSYDLLRDLTLGVFRLLSHTPLRALGINHSFHFGLQSEERWHAFGHKLAPKELWAGIVENPGTRSLTIQGTRPDEYAGNVFVQVEPSVRIENAIYIAVNDHFQLDAMEKTNAEGMTDVLASAWSPSAERASSVTSQLLAAT
jgi:hypothetical protein